MGSEMDSTRVLFTSCPCSFFAVQLLRPVTISTTKSSGHDPRHKSCYDSTVWSMMLWDVSFSLGAVPLSPQWDHTLALVSRNLCCDIRFQVTLSRLVSLAKCCSEQFGCHQSASVFCCRYPLSSLGFQQIVVQDNCVAKSTSDAEDAEIAFSLSACVPSFRLHTVHWFVLVRGSCPLRVVLNSRAIKSFLLIT